MQTELIERNGKKVFIIRLPEGTELRRSNYIEDVPLTHVIKDLPLDCDLLLNCSGLYFLDSFGIGEILSIYKILSERKRRFILVAVTPIILNYVRAIQLDKVLEIVPDEKTALSMLTDTPK